MTISLFQLKKIIQEELSEGKPDRRYGKDKNTPHDAEEDEKEKAKRDQRHKDKEDLKQKLKRENLTLTSSHLKEMIQEVVDELNEKCKGRGCATPSEVDDYAKAIEAGADNKDDVNPYAIAWNSARKKGSKGGRKVVEAKK